MYILATLLFIGLSPGFFLRIPYKGPLLTTILIHAALFATILYLASNITSLSEGFYANTEQMPSLTATLNNDDIAPLTVVATQVGSKTGMIRLPASLSSTLPYSLSLRGNTLGKITFPPGTNLPQGDYKIELLV